MIRKCRKIYVENKKSLLFVLGMLVVSMIAIPYALLGEGSYVQIHDQMDGEILNYIYQAKYLFKGDLIPEFMNGMDKASMQPPAPLGVLLYKIFSPFTAFAVMHWICLSVGFTGMYLLCGYCQLRMEVCFVTACIFCFIPFYPVYGLAALGQPLLIYSFLKMIRGEKVKSALICIVFYAAMSSLTLIGYVWIISGILGVGIFLAAKKKKEAVHVGIGTAVLTATYVVTNVDLLQSILGDGFETHRSEMVLSSTVDLWGKMKELLFEGGSYSPVYSAGILGTGLLFIVLGTFCLHCQRKAGQQEVAKHLGRCIKSVVGLGTIIFCGILLAVLWNCKWIVSLRNAIGGMVVYFQADRIYWTFPFVWMFAAGWILEGLLLCGEGFCLGRCRQGEKPELGKTGVGKRGTIILRVVSYGLCTVLVLAECAQIFRDSTLNKNLRLVLFEDYEQVTWASIYMEDVFEEIDRVIGEDKEKVSVVSLGIYPSVALYNGYTCADGYSNNYDLEYKHAFREIIAAELEKDTDVKAYLDDWGNRLYLAAQPYGINGMVEKGREISYEEVDFNVGAMKELNIGYLFSAAPVIFSEEVKDAFELVEGSPFSDANSYYEVWIYRIR